MTTWLLGYKHVRKMNFVNDQIFSIRSKFVESASRARLIAVNPSDFLWTPFLHHGVQRLYSDKNMQLVPYSRFLYIMHDNYNFKRCLLVGEHVNNAAADTLTTNWLVVHCMAGRTIPLHACTGNTAFLFTFAKTFSSLGKSSEVHVYKILKL